MPADFLQGSNNVPQQNFVAVEADAYEAPSTPTPVNVAGAGLVTATTTKTAAYTVNPQSDYTIRANLSAGAFTIKLPLLPVVGEIHIFKKIDSSTNALTISANGGTIDGSASLTITTQYGVLHVHCATAVSGASVWDAI